MYLSNVEHIKYKQINTKAIKGPFKYMTNSWNLIDKDVNFCLVEFNIKFELNSLILGKVIGSVLNIASKKIVMSFQNRAINLYGSN